MCNSVFENTLFMSMKPLDRVKPITLNISFNMIKTGYFNKLQHIIRNVLI